MAVRQKKKKEIVATTKTERETWIFQRQEETRDGENEDGLLSTRLRSNSSEFSFPLDTTKWIGQPRRRVFPPSYSAKN